MFRVANDRSIVTLNRGLIQGRSQILRTDLDAKKFDELVARGIIVFVPDETPVPLPEDPESDLSGIMDELAAAPAPVEPEEHQPKDTPVVGRSRGRKRKGT